MVLTSNAILTFDDLEKAIKTINKKEKPLAAYYFGNRKQDKDLFLMDGTFCYSSVSFISGERSMFEFAIINSNKNSQLTK